MVNPIVRSRNSLGSAKTKLPRKIYQVHVAAYNFYSQKSLSMVLCLPEEGELIPVTLWKGDKSRRLITSLSITTLNRSSVGGIGGEAEVESANVKHN